MRSERRPVQLSVSPDGVNNSLSGLVRGYESVYTELYRRFRLIKLCLGGGRRTVSFAGLGSVRARPDWAVLDRKARTGTTTTESCPGNGSGGGMGTAVQPGVRVPSLGLCRFLYIIQNKEVRLRMRWMQTLLSLYEKLAREGKVLQTDQEKEQRERLQK